MKFGTSFRQLVKLYTNEVNKSLSSSERSAKSRFIYRKPLSRPSGVLNEHLFFPGDMDEACVTQPN